MTVLNYAPFDVNALLRTVVVTNTGDAPLNDVVLTGRLGRTVVKDGRLYDSSKAPPTAARRARRASSSATFLEGAEAAGQRADRPGTLTTKHRRRSRPARRPSARSTSIFSMAETSATRPATLDLVQDARASSCCARRTTTGAAWLATTARVECPDQKLVDLLDDTKILVKIQTAEPQDGRRPDGVLRRRVGARLERPVRLYYLRMGELDGGAEDARVLLPRQSPTTSASRNWEPMDIDLTQPVSRRLRLDVGPQRSRRDPVAGSSCSTRGISSTRAISSRSASTGAIS